MLKRYAVIAVCYAICAPVLPFYFLFAAATAFAEFMTWAMQDRPWTLWFVDRAERFAVKHGVDL